MTRMSKQGERRNQSPRKRHYKPDLSTGPKKDNLPKGYKEHHNGIAEANNSLTYIGKVK